MDQRTSNLIRFAVQLSPPAGPTLRETVEGLRGRGQLTADHGEVLEITAPVFVMYGVFFPGPVLVDDFSSLAQVNVQCVGRGVKTSSAR